MTSQSLTVISEQGGHDFTFLEIFNRWTFIDTRKRKLIV